MNIKDLKIKYNLETPKKNGKKRIQGWGSESIAFKYVIEKVKPLNIIEVGTWLGASALHMAKISEADILCIDTFLASNEVLWREKEVENLNQDFSKLYDQFCINITEEKQNERISVLPMTSTSAAELCKKEQIKSEIVYIDAGHQYQEVYADLHAWWEIAEQAIIGDDYNSVWPGVIEATNQFAEEKKVNIQIIDSKFILWH